MIKRFLLKSLPFLISIGLIRVLFLRLDLSAVWAILLKTRPSTLILPSLLMVSFISVRTFKWQRLARAEGLTLTFPQALTSFLIGMGMGLWIPSIGEVGKAISLRRHRKKAFALAGVDKGIDLLALAGLSAISLLHLNRRLGLIALACVLMLAGIMGVIWRWGRRLPLKRDHPWLIRVGRVVKGILCIPVPALAVNLSLAFLSLLIYTVQFALLLPHGAIGMNFWASWVCLPLILLTSRLPISWAGMGVREAIAVALLPRFGLLPEQAASASLLLFVVSGLAPGGVGLLLIVFKMKD